MLPTCCVTNIFNGHEVCESYDQTLLLMCNFQDVLLAKLLKISNATQRGSLVCVCTLRRVYL